MSRSNRNRSPLIRKVTYIFPFLQAEKMTRISYIASSGGLLGLCMGFSFVSLAEIAYHCCLCCRIICGRFLAGLCAKSTDLFEDKYVTELICILHNESILPQDSEHILLVEIHLCKICSVYFVLFTLSEFIDPFIV